MLPGDGVVIGRGMRQKDKNRQKRESKKRQKKIFGSITTTKGGYVYLLV
jgi:hypothetical protein